MLMERKLGEMTALTKIIPNSTKNMVNSRLPKITFHLVNAALLNLPDMLSPISQI